MNAEAEPESKVGYVQLCAEACRWDACELEGAEGRRGHGMARLVWKIRELLLPPCGRWEQTAFGSSCFSK